MSITIGDADLIHSFQSGDHDVFAEIVRQYEDELIRHARRRVHDAAAAEDLVQDAFVRAYRAFDSLPCDSRLRPWLHRIVENLCIDESHRRRRELEKVQRVGTEAPLRQFGRGPEGELGLDFDDTALVAALADLPVTHRDALWSRYVDGLDYSEIADGANTTEMNARARVSRARAAMRRTFSGAASVPLFVFGLVRRPGGRHTAPVADAPNAALQTGATTAVHATTAANAATAANTAATAANTASVASSASTTASSIAASLSPAIEMVNHATVAGQNAMPLLTKAAVGIGAVAVAFTAAPERPFDTAPPITVEVAAPAPVPTPASLAAPNSTAPTTTIVVTTTTPPTTATPITIALDPAVVPVVVVTEVPVTTRSTTVVPTTTAVVVTAAPTSSAPAATSAPTTTEPTTTVAPTTSAPTTTAAPTTTETPPPPIVGGALSGSPSVSPSGPRLDVDGAASLTVAGTTASGSITGRIGVGEPDPSGSRRIDANLTVSLGTGTVEIRLAGHGTSAETPAIGVVPTSLTMSGMYRASGATGQLATMGSFTASLSNGSLSISFTP